MLAWPHTSCSACTENIANMVSLYKHGKSSKGCSKVWIKGQISGDNFAGTFFCNFGLKHDLRVLNFAIRTWEMVQGRQILMFYTTIVHIANVYGYVLVNPQKYQTLVLTKISHFKVVSIHSACQCKNYCPKCTCELFFYLYNFSIILRKPNKGYRKIQ